MPSGEHRVAVLGAAGFVGRELLARLEREGRPVTAIVRGPPEFAVEGSFHRVRSPADASAEGSFDVVVNLAYPTTGLPFEYAEQDAAIDRTIRSLTADGGHVVHASTLAVFGLALERPVAEGPVPKVKDAAYVESKVSAEHRLMSHQAERGLSVDVVRLGNVWGRGSGNWAQPLVHRLLTGRPVAVAGAPGLSNTTDVANAAAYLAFLLNREPSAAGVRFHHLAEFSTVSWLDWAGPIAAELGVEPVVADAASLSPQSSWKGEAREVLAPLAPRAMYRRMAARRVAGSLTRAALGRTPEAIRDKLKPRAVFAPTTVQDPDEETFLRIMAGCQEFRSVVVDGWSPEVTQSQSADQVLAWLRGDRAWT